MTQHTIILIQYNANVASRSYLDFPTVKDACDAVVKLYEHKLKELNPTVSKIQYGIDALYTFLDDLGDLVALV
jgi:Enhancer of rudimentary